MNITCPNTITVMVDELLMSLRGLKNFHNLHINLLLTDSSRTLNAFSRHFLGRPGTENPMLSSFSCALLSAL